MPPSWQGDASAADAAAQSTPPPSTVSVGGVTLRSVNVDFPNRDRQFEGPGADVVNNNCLTCHSAGMVLTQPRLPRAVWQAEVEKMRNTYKAPVDAEDVPAIVDYLANLPH
jgi:cytochrome c5